MNIVPRTGQHDDASIFASGTGGKLQSDNLTAALSSQGARPHA
jgi:hypothetical protein